MARQWYVATNASPEQLVQAFNEVFFVRPTFRERFKFSKAAQLRAQQVWEATRVDEADVAAQLVRGGLREAIQGSKRGVGSGIGTTVAMSVSREGDRSVGQLWLSSFNTFFGINQQGDVLKAYTRSIAEKLSAGGFSADSGKV